MVFRASVVRRYISDFHFAPKSRRSWIARLALAVAFLAAGTASAQQGTGAMTGTVFDNASKKPLPEVIVMIKSPSLQEDQIALTDSSGFYRIPNLPPGVYSIHFEKDGYFPGDQTGISIRSDVTLRLNAPLSLAQGQAEEVKIIVRPTVDVGSSSSSTTLNSDLLKRVPAAAPGGKGSASRSFESVAELAPGAANDDVGVGINGASSPENNYSIDGLSVGNPGKGTVGTQLSTEFVDEVNVVTAGYMPEFGRSTGGVLSVITKSGSNEFHGSVFSYYSPGALEGKRKLVLRDATPVAYDTKLSYIGDIGFDLGGPIVKDKLWFYVGFDISNSSYNIDRSIHRTLASGDIETTPLYLRRFVADSRTLQGMAKLTWSINADNRFTFAVYGTPTTSGGGGSFDGTNVTPGKYGIDPLSGGPEVGSGSTSTYGHSAHQYVSTPIDTSVKLNSQFLDKRLLLDVMGGLHYQNDSRRASDGSTATSNSGLGQFYAVNWRRAETSMQGFHDIRDFEGNFPGSDKCDQDGANCHVAEYSSGAPPDLNEATYYRYHGSVILSYLANALGHHLFKAGVDGEMTTYKNDKSNRVFKESSDGTQFDDEERFGQLLGPDNDLMNTSLIDHLSKKSRAMTIGAFVQDSWSILDKVTLNLGARYDTQYFYNATSGKVILSLPNQLSPRLGIIFDPTFSGKSKVYFNYARYYENAPLDFADVGLLGEPQLAGGHACDAGVFANQRSTSATGCQNQDNLRPNSDSEPALPNKFYIGGGAPNALDPDIKASSADEISGGAEYEIFADSRIGLSATRRWLNRWIEDMGPVANAPGFIGNPGYGLGSVFPKASRNYTAFTLFFTKSFSKSWLTQASYTLAHLRGNYAGLIAPEDGYLGPNATADFDGPNVENNRYGDLPGDIRHNIKVLASRDWQIASKQSIGTGISLRATSGGATSYLGADPFTYPMEAYLVQRGTGPRLPWTYGADLQLSYRVAVVKDVAISLSLDVFNVLNLQAVTNTDQEYTSENVETTQGYKIADLDKLTNTDGVPIVKKPSFGQPTDYQDPRVFRFGLRGSF